MTQCKTIDISLMCRNALNDFINGDLSFEDACEKYPGKFDLEITEDKADKDSNTVTLSVRK